MNITWFKEASKPGQATLYSSNITLNKVAIKNFEGYNSVLLGIDFSTKQVVIKPCKEGTDDSCKISMAASYGRVTNKDFMKVIMRILDNNLTNPLKLETLWDDSVEALVINLKGSVN